MVRIIAEMRGKRGGGAVNDLLKKLGEGKGVTTARNTWQLCRPTIRAVEVSDGICIFNEF